MAKIKTKKILPFAHPWLLVIFVVVVTVNIFVAGYLNSRELKVNKSLAYEPQSPVASANSVCSRKAANYGLMGWYAVEFNPWTTKSTEFNKCTSDSIYVGWGLTSYNKAVSCCVKPADNNLAQNNACGKGSVVMTYQNYVDKKDFPYSCNYSTGNVNCIRNRDWNYEANTMYLFHQSAWGNLVNTTIPGGDAKSCNWLGGNSQSDIRPGFCCP